MLAAHVLCNGCYINRWIIQPQPFTDTGACNFLASTSIAAEKS